MDFEDIGLWGLFFSAFISSTLAPGGSEAVLAYMVSEAKHSIPNLLAVASVGNTLGALTTWGLGSLAARKYPMQRLLSEKQQKNIDTVKKWGEFALLFSWLPVIGDGLCFAGGWLKMPLLLSSAAIAIGKVIRYAFVAFLFV